MTDIEQTYEAYKTMGDWIRLRSYMEEMVVQARQQTLAGDELSSYALGRLSVYREIIAWSNEYEMPGNN